MKIFLPFLLCCLLGCGPEQPLSEPSKEIVIHPYKNKELPDQIDMSTVKFATGGHSWIRFSEAQKTISQGSIHTPSVVHDPDCLCTRK